jgi:triacylglycerol lipase
MGFDELRLAGHFLPSVHYWRGIKDAFNAHGIECITTAVPTTGSIDERAKALYSQILAKLPSEPNSSTSKGGGYAEGQDSTSTPKGRRVNIVAHSMGGLDARYLISRLCPDPETEFQVASLTTVATPHRGSSAADMLFRDIGPDLLPRLYRLLDRLKISSGAFSQLTTPFINERFNPVTPNSASTRYFSYGATATPHLLSVFRVSHDLLAEVEGPNDGLVSVRSSKWGEYKGTLVGVTHLDLINWTNRIKSFAARLGLVDQKFNAVAFYLGVADMLAKEDL